MRFAYLTTDEVNPDLARRWAWLCRCQVAVLSPCDPLPDGEYDAAIYDLDYLLSPLRKQVLTRLLRDPLPCPVAVHSYNLRPRQAKALRARGVVVRRRLDRGVLLTLRREVARLRAAARQEQTVTLAPASSDASDSIALPRQQAKVADYWRL